MGTCEMCGTNASLNKTRVEGAVLKVCDDCASVGESMETTQTARSQRRSSSSRGDTELAGDYNAVVKEAREDKGWSVGELAGKLKEKDSVIRRIESGKLTPNKQLARKLEKTLDIDLYESFAGVTTSSNSRSESGGATIGDMADLNDS